MERRRRIISTGFVALWVGIISYMRYITEIPGGIAFSVGFIFTGILWWFLWGVSKKPLLQRSREFSDGLWSKVEHFFSERALFFTFWSLGLIFFVLAYLAFFPGIFGYDAPVQFAMFMGDMDFDSAQQPLLHTLLIGIMFLSGKAVFKSYQAGLALLVAIQGIVITNCMAQVFLFLKRRRVSLLVVIPGMLWVVVNPFLQVLNCNITKDVLFGIFMIDFLLALLNMLEKEEPGISDGAKLVITGILTCLFRNGLVLPVFAIMVFCFFTKVRKRQLYISLAIVILFTECFSFSAEHIWGIKKSPTKEFLSVPIQQMAYALYLYGNEFEDLDISTDEKELIYELMPDMDVIMYNFIDYCADPPKTIFRDDLLKSDPIKYGKAYLSLGWKNMEIYKDAWLYLILPYFDMNRNENRQLMTENTFSYFYDNEKYNVHPQEGYFPGYKQYLLNAVRGEVKTIHDSVIAILILGLFIGKCIGKGDRKTGTALVFIVFYFVGCLLAPIALFRYMYPLMMAVPLMLGLLFQREDLTGRESA